MHRRIVGVRHDADPHSAARVGLDVQRKGQVSGGIEPLVSLVGDDVVLRVENQHVQVFNLVFHVVRQIGRASCRERV